MFEKDLSLAELLDQYAPILRERHRMLLDLYYNQDLSLGEIAAEVGISRQGVRDCVKKAEEELRFFENGLHLAARARAVAGAGARALALAPEGEAKGAVEDLLRAAQGPADEP